MFCLKCGHKCRDDAKFCGKCGAPIVPIAEVKRPEVPINQTVKDKKRFPKVPCFIAAGVVLTVLAILLIVVNRKDKKSSKYEFISSDAITVISETLNDEKYYIFVNGKGQVLHADHTYEIWDYQQNATQDVIAFNTCGYKKVCVLKDKKMIEISDDAFDYTLSADGSKIAYLEEEKNNCGTLYVRDINKKKPVKIAEDVCDNSMVLSPNGNTLAFIASIDGEDVMCLSINGKKAKVYKEDEIPLAVSNDGSYLYYLDGKKLFVQKGDDKKRLSKDYCGWSYVNQDCSEILFFDLDRMYLSQNGGEREAFCELTHTYLLPNQVTEVKSSQKEYECNRMGVESFLDVGYRTHDGYAFYDKDFNEHILCDDDIDDRDIFISAKGDTALYAEEGLIYRKKIMEDEEAELIGDGSYDAKHFLTDKNLESIYYTDYDETLNYIDKSGKIIEISEKCLDAGIDDTDDTCYFVSNNEDNYFDYFSSKNGSKRKPVNTSLGNLEAIDRKGPHYVFGTIDEEETIMEIFMLLDGKAVPIVKADKIEDMIE